MAIEAVLALLLTLLALWCACLCARLLRVLVRFLCCFYCCRRRRAVTDGGYAKVHTLGSGELDDDELAGGRGGGEGGGGGAGKSRFQNGRTDWSDGCASSR